MREQERETSFPWFDGQLFPAFLLRRYQSLNSRTVSKRSLKTRRLQKTVTFVASLRDERGRTGESPLGQWQSERVALQAGADQRQTHSL